MGTFDFIRGMHFNVRERSSFLLTDKRNKVPAQIILGQIQPAQVSAATVSFRWYFNFDRPNIRFRLLQPHKKISLEPAIQHNVANLGISSG